MKKNPDLRASYNHGGCDIVSAGNIEGMANIIITPEEALRLNLSLQGALLKINRLDRRTKAGRGAAVKLVVNQGQRNIMVFNVTI